MKILIADDEKSLLNFLLRGLNAEGYECSGVSTLDEIPVIVKTLNPELVILDRLFGEQDSLNSLTSIRRAAPDAMILLLTALDDVNERVAGLRQGADDYLCKPFDFEELLARIEALGRRVSKHDLPTETELVLGPLRIDRAGHIVYIDNEELQLTRIEFDLLLYLAENHNKVLSRERILNRVWGSQSDPMTNIIDVYISRLRQKIDPPQLSSYIQTLRGHGYRLRISELATADQD
ncbi:response regulator transcription factor [Pseudohongiella spirulinae]|uniref:Two component transcriptional regulator, winged helix family protein n=1 Tax=Pseudohongiella spirulinae TaxID=1249552 RepID=A0A0S2KHP6_9GAMM|nr:response regulator transcription factor [Pseudohongiella spirulinae]ALO47474.1 Two component transcriptional regulator, winged helix family protein [Pseudohongiella spirulinae]